MCFNPNKGLFLIPYDNAIFPGWALDFSFYKKRGKIICETNETESRKYDKNVRFKTFSIPQMNKSEHYNKFQGTRIRTKIRECSTAFVYYYKLL